MDLLIGVVMGAALACFIYLVVRTLKKRYQTSIQNAETNAATYHELVEKLGQAVSKMEFSELKDEIELKVKQLDSEDYKKLESTVEHFIREIDQKEAERAETLPKLQRFRELKHSPHGPKLFNELHRIYLEVDDVITYDLLEEYGEKSDIEWIEKTYDKLLVERMRELLIVTRSGAVDDYQEVMQLWEELKDFTSSDGQNREKFFAKHLANEWNEMVACFVPESEWFDAMLGLDDLNSDDYREIVRKAYDDDDFLSQRLVLWFGKDDVEFRDVLLETFLQKLRTVQKLHIGFEPTH